MLVWCMIVEHVVSMQDCGMRGCAGEDGACVCVLADGIIRVDQWHSSISSLQLCGH